MEVLKIYEFDGVHCELYLAASGDHCVMVERYGEKPEYYNCGTYEEAMNLIYSFES